METEHLIKVPVLCMQCIGQVLESKKYFTKWGKISDALLENLFKVALGGEHVLEHRIYEFGR
jgi:hypothetical protein